MFYNNGYNQNWSTLKKLIWLRGNPATGQIGTDLTVSGTPPLSLPNSLGKPLKAWSVDVMPYQEGTGDPSPDNVRAIHGTDKVTITTAGKNLYDKTAYPLTLGHWINQNDGARITGNTSFAATDDYIPLSLPVGSTITLNHTPAGANPGFAFYDSTKTFISGGKGSAMTVPYGCAYIRFTVDATYQSGADVQIEFGSTATPYTPYLAPSQTVIDVPPLSANQWDEEWESGIIDTRTGRNSANSNQIRTKGFTPIESGNTYCLVTCAGAGNGVWAFFYDSEKNVITNPLPDTAFTKSGYAVRLDNGAVLTVPSNYKYVRWYFQLYYGTTYQHDTSLNYPATVTTYNPYNATVYTGTIGSEGGESRWVKDTFKWSDGVSEVAPTGNQFKRRTFVLSNSPLGGAGTAITNCIGTYNAGTPTTTPFFYVERRFYAWLPVDTDEDFELEVCYELATPTTFAVTSPTIPTPTGTATTWATAEDGTVESMEVTYVGKA